jgi:hypothetical protein
MNPNSLCSMAGVMNYAPTVQEKLFAVPHIHLSQRSIAHDLHIVRVRYPSFVSPCIHAEKLPQFRRGPIYGAHHIHMALYGLAQWKLG